MRATLTLAVALFTMTAPPTHSTAGNDVIVATDSPLPRFVELKPDADGKIRIEVVRHKTGPRFQTAAKVLVRKLRAQSPASITGKSTSIVDSEDYVAMGPALLQSHVVLLRVGEQLKKNETLRLPPADGDYLTYLNSGLTVSRLKDPTNGAYGNVLSITFVSPDGEDGKKVVAAIVQGCSDYIFQAQSAGTEDTFKSILRDRDRVERKLTDAQIDWEKAHEAIRVVSTLTAADLRSRIAVNESALRSLESEKLDIEYNLSLLQNTIRDGKDKASVLICLKITGDIPLADDPAKADSLKRRTNGLFELCMESTKMKLEANKRKTSQLTKMLDEDQRAARKLNQFVVAEKILTERMERFRNQSDGLEERKQAIELRRDAPLFHADIISAPFTVKLKSGAVERVELGDVKDLRITTAGGKAVNKEEALNTLAKGGLVVVATDAKAISSNFHKLLKDDVLVLVSPEFLGVGAKVDEE